jgi:dihydrodipicolinate synthase/N-acetylneuraminate lyase
MDGIYENQLQRTRCSTTSSNKEALVQLGEIKSSLVRAPGISVTEERKAEIRRCMQKAGLLPA